MPSVSVSGMFAWAAAAAVLSFLLGFASRGLARQTGAIDQPTGGRKIHTRPVPLLGGLGIGLVLVCFALLQHLYGFAASLLILMIGGALDDKFNLKPKWQFGFILVACLTAVLTGTNVVHITNWAGGAPVELGWLGYVLAFAWLVIVTFAMKFMDGLDGLVSGQTVIGAALIAVLALSAKYYQPDVALLAFVVGGAFLGFLPANFHPAKQFLGESGATIAGFSLGFLSILGGAKLATGLMALGFPLVDAGFVVLGRVARGAPFWKGDDTHLHFKLLKAGLGQRQIVFLIWGISLAVGLVALDLQSIGKVALLALLAIVVLALGAWASTRKAV
ncbi:MAG TPA: MraY family glycosyltransferase [Verrucomicrobiae bacterium]|nr:MraY family glycosyltransferase [Verrucomicrobiae bacterium]